MDRIDIDTLCGAAIAPQLDAVARLRIAVFAQWPYLYAGDVGYERDYLRVYADSPRSMLVLARAGERIVGASTGLPMEDEAAAFRAPFEAAGIDPATVFYCGESVLLPEHRGQGIGHAFFDAREAHARRLGGFEWIAFAAVDRDPGDPRRPPGHRDHHAFWRGRGYARREDLAMRLSWNEVGRGDSDHSLTFWLRPLEASS